MENSVQSIMKESGKPHGCGCKKDEKKTTVKSESIELKRLETAIKTAKGHLSSRLKGQEILMDQTQVHTFSNGFCVGSCGGSDKEICLSVSGVVNTIPNDFNLTWDMDFFSRESRKGSKEKNILWVEMETFGPTSQKVKIPFRGVGVLRNPGTGSLISVQNFELATGLISSVSLGSITAVIACVVACIGTWCAIVCAAACVTPLSCVMCALACLGASAPQFSACIAGCGIFI